jgi:hypothetical protein
MIKRRITFCQLTFLLSGLLACNPVYNWRETRIPEAHVKLMMPCKPDTGSRQMQLAGQSVLMQMTGCETDGTLFVLAHVEMPDAHTASESLEQWKRAMLRNMQAPDGTPETTSSVKNLGTRIQAVRLQARGKQENGKVVQAQAIWFARGAHLYHAAIYADKPNQDAVENFLSEIELE